MNDEQIIKALGICMSEHLGCEDGCPLADNGLTYSKCVKELPKIALDLITRQKTEIERLKAEADMADGYADALIQQAKSKAYREFAEKLCKDRVSNDPVVIAVKVELEELTESNE